jgi:hypothetical protein
MELRPSRRSVSPKRPSRLSPRSPPSRSGTAVRRPDSVHGSTSTPLRTRRDRGVSVMLRRMTRRTEIPMIATIVPATITASRDARWPDRGGAPPGGVGGASCDAKRSAAGVVAHCSPSRPAAAIAMRFTPVIRARLFVRTTRGDPAPWPNTARSLGPGGAVYSRVDAKGTEAMHFHAHQPIINEIEARILTIRDSL